jgi:hypothetical protein
LHPRLRGRFDEHYPDDLRVIAHDGGPQLSRVPPEVVWVRVTSGQGIVWTGRILTRAHEPLTADENVTVRFIAPGTNALPVTVTEKYLRERSDWIIAPCNRCGIEELFDAPSDLARVLFETDHDPGDVASFSAVCAWCGGTQLVHRARAREREGRPVPALRWWRVWKGKASG